MKKVRAYNSLVRVSRNLTAIVFFLFAVSVGGCDLFAPRTPDDPISEGGTFIQPDTPDQVVDNVEAAVSELNAFNYRRSLAPDLAFRPADEARYPIWAGWGRADEERYFKTMAASAITGGQHTIQFSDERLTAIDENRYEFSASYVLTIQHDSPNVPRVARGQLIWILMQGMDGLWSISEWTDEAVSNEPTWSDIKAGFH